MCFAQQALGHNSKSAHRAYAKHAAVTVPSLDDWETGLAPLKRASEPVWLSLACTIASWPNFPTTIVTRPFVFGIRRGNEF